MLSLKTCKMDGAENKQITPTTLSSSFVACGAVHVISVHCLFQTIVQYFFWNIWIIRNMFDMREWIPFGLHIPVEYNRMYSQIKIWDKSKAFLSWQQQWLTSLCYSTTLYYNALCLTIRYRFMHICICVYSQQYSWEDIINGRDCSLALFFTSNSYIYFIVCNIYNRQSNTSTLDLLYRLCQKYQYI